MIPNAVFVAATAVQNKFPLSSKVSRNPGSMPKTYTHVLSTSGMYMAGFRVKSFGECCANAVLTGISFWPPTNCIPVQKVVSLSTELTQNRSALVLDSDSGLRCRHSSSQSISGFSELWPAGQIRPAEPFHPAAKHILPMMKKLYIYEKCVDVIECDISRKNHITQDVWPLELLCNSLYGHSQKS